MRSFRFFRANAWYPMGAVAQLNSIDATRFADCIEIVPSFTTVDRAETDELLAEIERLQEEKRKFLEAQSNTSDDAVKAELAAGKEEINREIAKQKKKR